MNSKLSVVALALAVTVSGAWAQASAEKKVLSARILQAQKPNIEAMARTLAEEPAANLLEAANAALPQRIPEARREQVSREIGVDVRKYATEVVPLVQAKALELAPKTMGAMMEERFTEDELRQIASIIENPAWAKFQQNSEAMQRALLETLINDTRSEVEPKVRDLEDSLARRLGVSNAAADEIITNYKRRFSGITTFLHECIEQAQRLGFVETILKRRRPIPDIDSTNPSRRAFAERTAINSVVQGSAADLIKLAMVDILTPPPGGTGRGVGASSALDSARMLLQIHDELVFECPEPDAPAAMAAIVARMEGAMTLTVPLKVDAHLGKNWFEGK